MGFVLEVEEQIKTTLENIQPEEKLETHRINKPNYAAAWKETVKEEEPPMPLEQWNKMIEEAEKEVAKEDPKKKTSNYIMRAETGDKQVKIKDRVEE